MQATNKKSIPVIIAHEYPAQALEPCSTGLQECMARQLLVGHPIKCPPNRHTPIACEREGVLRYDWLRDVQYRNCSATKTTEK